MYLDHRTTQKIAHVLDMADMNALLIDISGGLILPEDDSRVFNLPEQVKSNPTIPMVYGGVTLIGTAEENPVFICLHGNSEEIRKCAVLCAELVNRIMREDFKQTNREQSLRLMLGGEIESDEFETLAAEHAIPFARRRCVVSFRTQEMEAETAMQLLTAEKDSEEDLMAVMGRHTVAVLKTVEDDAAYDEVLQYAQAVEETFLTEYGAAVLTGISDPCEQITDIPEAYRQARAAIAIGGGFHPNRSIFIYRNLLLERFLTDVPGEMCADYNAQIFNRKTARLFNEEMLRTIETFFDNSLNLSETARKLYIHRNTLVYRLEKIQRITGLDLRNFDDAVTFKMMMLLGKKENAKKNR